jgi:hypothetical protein
MTDRDERAGKNEALFREINERIEEVSSRSAPTDPTMEVLCECGRPDCHERVSVPLADYERVRAVATHFIVLPGHENGEVERVASANDAYLVVEKKDEAAIMAEETNPRD